MNRLVFALACAIGTAAFADDGAEMFSVFCIRDNAPSLDLSGKTPLEILQAANELLTYGQMLSVSGQTASFGVGMIGAPNFTVKAFHNGLVFMDRGYLHDFSEECSRLPNSSGVVVPCPDELRPLPKITLNQELPQSSAVVMDTLVLRHDKLTFTSIQSATSIQSLNRPDYVETYTCSDPDELLRFMKPSP